MNMSARYSCLEVRCTTAHDLPGMKSGCLKNQSKMRIMKEIKTEISWVLMAPRASYFCLIT